MRKKKTERGATILESLISIMLLCLIFFGLMQIFQWSVAQMLAEYSSFYAAKTYSQGYASNLVKHYSQGAIAGTSGKDISTPPISKSVNADRQEREIKLSEHSEFGVVNYVYMTDQSKDAISKRFQSNSVNYEYWIDQSGKSKSGWEASSTPIIYIQAGQSDTDSKIIRGAVTVINMPLLFENLGWTTGGAKEANPSGQASTFNHASLYLEDSWLSL